MRISTKETPELLEFLRSVWSFDDETGSFKWKPKVELALSDRQWNGRFAGKPVGGSTEQGYLRTSIKYSGSTVSLLLHRVVWAFHYGNWPDKMIDHENEIKSDNRPDNLRLASACQNISNRVQKNSTGIKGVRYDKRSDKFQARIMVNGISIHLGMFDDPESAGVAYYAAAKKHYKEFAKTNLEGVQ